MFTVMTAAKWRLSIDHRDMPAGQCDFELESREEPYALQFHVHGAERTRYEVTVTGATLLQPIEGAIPRGYTRSNEIVDLQV